MHLHVSTIFLATTLTPLWNSVLRASAAPDASLASRIQAYLKSQGVNATIPASTLAQAPDDHSSATLSCGILNSYRNNDLVTAQDGQVYTTEAQQHWSPTAFQTPDCIFEPTSISEVQFAVGLLAITGTTYAVRSGGHSPFPGFASTNSGVLIAMHQMKTVEYDSGTETVRLAMGNTWGDVYSTLIPHNRIVVGGRLPPVGMALVTGGGLSHLSNEYGFASDNVVNFEMILANGTLVNANATSNSDLWFAMKAGQNNFGVTTHITTKAIELGQVWGGLRQWNASQLDAVSDAFAEYQRVGQLDQKSSVIADLVTTNGSLFVTLVYLAPVNSTPAAFDAFYKIPAVADNSQLRPNFLDLISVGPPQVVPRWSYGTTTIRLDNSNTYRDVMEICANQAKKLKGVNGGTHVIIPQPISKNMIDVAQRTGGRPQGLRSQAQLWMNMSWGWNLAKDDQYVWNLIQETTELVEKLTKQRGVYDPYLFLNDAYPSQKVLQSYGAENFALLKTISKKYDPNGIFQSQVPGGFKLN